MQSIANQLLPPALFDRSAAQWLAVVDNPDSTALEQLFAAGEAGRGQYVSFSVQQIVQLVSAVGAQLIKARFLVRTEEATGRPYFSLALYATDALGQRLTAYYGAASPGPLAPAPAELGAVVSDGLADYWRQQWRAAASITPANFTSTYGPLRGYSFELTDFTALLAQLPSFNQEQVWVYFGLHEYYRPEPAGDAQVQLFGLILRLRDPDALDDDDSFYDMSKPCPPTC